MSNQSFTTMLQSTVSELADKAWIGLVTTMTKSYVEKGVPLIRNSDIKEGYIRTEGMINLDPEFAELHSGRRVKAGDVVSVHTGDIATSSLIPQTLDGAHGFATINTRVDNQRIYNKYLCYFFNSSHFKQQAYRVITGDGRDNLNLKEFLELKVMYPPDIEHQKKIANVLCTLDNLIKETLKLIEKYTAVKQGMMADLFSRGIDLSGTPETNKRYGQLRPSYEEAPELYQETELGWVPKDWKVQSIKERIEISYGKSQVAVRDNDGSIPVYGTGGFIEYVNSTMSEADSILIGRKGTLNNPYYIEAPFWVVDTAYFVSKFIDGDMRFLARRLSTFDFVKLNESTGVPSLNRETLYREKLAFPPLYEQIEINRRIEAVDKYLDRYNAEKTKTINIKKGLMHDLLTGKVKV
ncbi:restriction endonuclease subunit S [Alteromonas sp. S167]|uniref:restriction endonuclease subunit S n=1 Tax=Alteromonas sp. S167 TaxID=3117402 RepID=UPI002FDFAFB2